MNVGRKANLVAYRLLQNEVICVVDRPVSVAQSSAQTCASTYCAAQAFCTFECRLSFEAILVRSCLRIA